MLHGFSARVALVPALILNLAAGPRLLSAQQAPTEIPGITIRATTRLVVVDVVAADKKGQAVPGLKAEDFTVEENGKKQKISVFVPPGATYRTTPPAPPPGVLSNHPEHVGPAGVPTVLILDAANSPFKEQAYARSQMLKYVVEQGQSGNPMAVLTLTDELRVLQQFTSDPQVLITAIKELRPQEQILRSAPPPPESHGMADRPGGGGAANAQVVAAMAAAQAFADLQVGYNLERRTLITIEAMRALSRMLGGLPGRKNVVWLTASLPFDLIPEDRNVSDAELMADLPSIQQKSLGTVAAGAVASQQRQLHGPEIKEAEARLATANVAIYPVDLHGLISGMESSAASAGSVINSTALSDRALSQTSSLVASQGTMQEVAAQTGGKAYVNENEIKNGISLAVSDAKASYTLGYYPENKKWNGALRNIKVKVDQGDTQLRYRKGYFAIEPIPSKDHGFEQDVAAALELNAPATQISFMAQAKPTDPGKMQVVFLVDAHTLSAEDANGGKKMNVSLYASVYNSSGKNLGTRSTKVDRTFDAATYQQILEKGMMVPIDLEVPSGGKELRLAVLDNKTDLIGTVSGPLGE
jgi:VWFA-related protein